MVQDTASRGPTTIVTPKSQFRTCPTDHGKAPSGLTNLPQSTEKRRVLETPVGARHKCQTGDLLNTLYSIGYPRMKASGESSTTKHRLLHAYGPHPISPPNDPKLVSKRVKVRRLSCRVSMTLRVVRTNQYNQDLGLIHSTNGNHLESPNEGSSIDHQVTIHLHAQNIIMFPTNETWSFTLTCRCTMADGWRCSDAAGRPDAAHDDAGRVLRALTGRVVAQRLRRAVERGAARCRRVFRGGGAARATLSSF
ncbi:hypothetical protein F511_11727 [Dorcoceras hygrometricum]|uniref:Uncharacterized protein n=1 Tax=Dorcoceras hygrometricum TaxID=472368 RepID=A0A2Z7A6A2_9LAMI|nr:hypothetical protein F511_11727 [Dorcoceras hygrometricum]